MKKRILLVEDEPHLAFNIEFNLQAEGYEVVPATNGQIALDKFFNDGPFDLIILDIMIPEIDGIKVAKEIRKTDNQTGILMLTARSSKEDIVMGLETGADDYMTKPFLLKEFLLRVKRMVKRSELFTAKSSEEEKVLTCGDITLDIESLELINGNEHHILTVLEANVLKEFMKNPGKVLTRDHLLTTVWGVNGKIETRTVDNFILRLRKYLERDPSNPTYLESIRGRGYRFRSENQEQQL
jgi:DNA-binding response OmpR family regulator